MTILGLICRTLKTAFTPCRFFCFRSRWRYNGFLENYKLFRQYQLWIALFNIANSQGIFLTKLCAISSGNLWGYSALISWDHFAHGIFSSIIFADTLGLYSVLYEKAFAIPDEFKTAKKAMLIGIRASRLGLIRRAYAKRCVWSIPNAGIRVGSFHTFERLSTPIFVDFVVRNVAGLLLMQSQ